MSEILARALRPKTLDDMIGQEAVVASIRNQIATGRIPMCWMFSGESRGGKTTLAKILGVALNKPTYENFGVLTDADWEVAKTLDVIERNASAENGVDAARELIGKTSFYPMSGRFRIIIIDEAQKLTKEAQNALLIPTENSTINVWIFCTTEPDKIIDPLQKRCVRHRMKPLDRAGIFALLNWALPRISTPPPAISQEFVNAIMESDITAPGVITMALEQFLAGVPIADAINSVNPTVETRDVCRAVLGGQWGPVQAFLMKASPEEIATLRYQILGYLRRVALGASGSSKRAADLCVYLGENAPYDNVACAAWLTGKLFNVCAPPTAASPYGQPTNGYAANA